MTTAFDRNAAVARYGPRLTERKAAIRADFLDRKLTAPQAADELTVLMDETLQSVWHDIGTHHHVDLADHLALLAVGGYGRGQLAPFSDLDLLFLRVSKDLTLQDAVVEDMLYVLWDLKLKVGQALRTAKECMQLGAEDPTILTSLLDLRLIRGSREGFVALRKSINMRLVAPRRRAFVAAKIAEREARHGRHGQSRYVLEPNVKENKGGLRDLHALSWIARAVFDDGQVATLMSRGVFSKSQATSYSRAETFLLTVRFHLHYLSNRAEERLSFDAQVEVARAMGFEDGEARSGVEAFMQAYFKTAIEVGSLSGIMIATIEEEFAAKGGLFGRAWTPKFQKFKGFRLQNGRLMISGAQQLAEQPIDFLRYFHVAHEHELDFAPSSLRLISQNTRLIEDALRNSAKANALFLELLTHARNPTLTLRTMNETGVLSAFLPEWESIVGLMQFNRYHHYTVDEHTIRAVDQLHFMAASDQGEVTAPVNQVLEQIADNRSLFVAMLYHDIAKGRPGRHEIVGAELAPAICKRLGLTDAESDRVSWLILEHLSLSNAAFRRDVDDMATLESIAAKTQSVDALRMLYALTAADVRAVGPDTWSAWKGALLQRAYIGAGEVLRSGEVGEGAGERAGKARRLTAEALGNAGVSSEALAPFMNSAPEPYWLAYPQAIFAEHFHLFARAPEVELKVLKNRQAIALRVCTPDEPGLFARIAGGVALAGWTVEATKAHTFANGMALDTFYVDLPGQKKVPSKGEQETLKTCVETALSGKLSLKHISERLPRGRSKRLRAMDRPARVRIETPELLKSPTIIEVSGPDRPALLFDLTATLMQLGLTLKSVRVATYGERFVNVFYVTDLMGQRVEGETRLDRIKTLLLHAAENKVEL